MRRGLSQTELQRAAYADLIIKAAKAVSGVISTATAIAEMPQSSALRKLKGVHRKEVSTVMSLTAEYLEDHLFPSADGLWAETAAFFAVHISYEEFMRAFETIRAKYTYAGQSRGVTFASRTHGALAHLEETPPRRR